MTDAPVTPDHDQPALDVPADAPPADAVPKPAPKRRGRPPRDPSAPAPAKPATRTRRAAPKPDVAKRIAEMYVIVGGGLMIVPSGPARDVPVQHTEGPGGAPVPVPGPTITQQIGLSIIANSAAIGAAWAKVAEEDKRVADVIDRLLTVSVFGALLAAHLPIVVAAGAASGAVPAGVAQLLTPQE